MSGVNASKLLGGRRGPKNGCMASSSHGTLGREPECAGCL